MGRMGPNLRRTDHLDGRLLHNSNHANGIYQDGLCPTGPRKVDKRCCPCQGGNYCARNQASMVVGALGAGEVIRIIMHSVYCLPLLLAHSSIHGDNCLFLLPKQILVQQKFAYDMLLY